MQVDYSVAVPSRTLSRGDQQTQRRWATEILGATVALSMSIGAVSHLASSERAALLFSDGDSLINVLIARSLHAEQAQDWVFSSVLFMPEFIVYYVLSLLNLPVMATLALNAIVNLLALYAAIRYLAAVGRSHTAAILASLLALGAFNLFIMLESSNNRDSFELASLMATTTYYSASVIGAVVTLGVVLRIVARNSGLPWAHTALLVVVVAGSTMTNPIFLAWSVAPLIALTIVLVLMQRISNVAAFHVLCAMLGGSIIGLAARVPLSDSIANSGVGYIRPADWQLSLDYYGELLGERAETPQGTAALALLVMLVAVSLALTAHALTTRSVESTYLAAAAWFVPLVVCIGALAAGTHAARYLQPVLFMPVLALILVPSVLPPASEVLARSWSAVGAAFVALGITVVAVVTVPRLIDVVSAETPSPALQCVTEWVDSSGRTGAGQFWTIRAAKAYVQHGEQLVQVDHRLNPYHWLVNRADYRQASVSFLITDSQTPDFELPDEVAASAVATINCGDYTITDFGERRLELGEPHS